LNGGVPKPKHRTLHGCGAPIVQPFIERRKVPRSLPSLGSACQLAVQLEQIREMLSQSLVLQKSNHVQSKTQPYPLTKISRRVRHAALVRKIPSVLALCMKAGALICEETNCYSLLPVRCQVCGLQTIFLSVAVKCPQHIRKGNMQDARKVSMGWNEGRQEERRQVPVFD
jgi:hypothetical protein